MSWVSSTGKSHLNVFSLFVNSLLFRFKGQLESHTRGIWPDDITTVTKRLTAPNALSLQKTMTLASQV